MRLPLLLFAFALLTVQVGFAQSDFSGSITYGFEYENVPAHLKAQTTARATGMTVHISGSQSRTEHTGGSRVGPAVVLDSKTGDRFVLMDLFGVNIALVGPKDTIPDSTAQVTYSYPFLDKSRLLAGYACQHALVTYPDSSTAEIWYTTDIPCNDEHFPGLPGQPLAFTLHENGFTIVATASAVNSGAVDASLFTIPKSHAAMTQSAFQTFMQTFGQ